MTELAQIDAAPQQHAATGGGAVAGVLAILLFAVLSVAASLSSKGFLEADGCTHYLYARFALSEPHFLTNVWGRPLFTMIYAIPSALGGLIGARVVSLGFAIGCALLALLIARGQGYRWPMLALIFTLAQPLVFLHSFSELTELPFAALLAAGFFAYQRRKWLATAILLGLGPLSRPEGFAFILLGTVALVVQRRWWWILVLPLPLLIWDIAGWTMSGREAPWWGWLAANWPYSRQSLYETGHALHYVALLPAVTSPFIFPAACLGIWKSFSIRLQTDWHLRTCQILIAIIPLLVLLGHSVLYATGKLASSGEIRYMLIVAPFWGLLAAKGWETVFTAMQWRYPIAWAGAAAVAGALANAFYPVVPLRTTPDFERSEQFVNWYRTSGIESQFPRVCTAQMCIYYLLDVSPTDPDRALEYHRERVSRAPAGTILLWDPTYSLYNADQRRSIPIEELVSYGWIETPAGYPDFGGGWRVFLNGEAPPAPASAVAPQQPP